MSGRVCPLGREICSGVGASGPVRWRALCGASAGPVPRLAGPRARATYICRGVTSFRRPGTDEHESIQVRHASPLLYCLFPVTPLYLPSHLTCVFYGTLLLLTGVPASSLSLSSSSSLPVLLFLHLLFHSCTFSDFFSSSSSAFALSSPLLLLRVHHKSQSCGVGRGVAWPGRRRDEKASNHTPANLRPQVPIINSGVFPARWRSRLASSRLGGGCACVRAWVGATSICPARQVPSVRVRVCESVWVRVSEISPPLFALHAPSSLDTRCGDEQPSARLDLYSSPALRRFGNQPFLPLKGPA